MSQARNIYLVWLQEPVITNNNYGFEPLTPILIGISMREQWYSTVLYVKAEHLDLSRAKKTELSGNDFIDHLKSIRIMLKDKNDSS